MLADTALLLVCVKGFGLSLRVTGLHAARWGHLHFLRLGICLLIPRPLSAASSCCSVCPVMKRCAFHISFFCSRMKWKILICKGEESLFFPCSTTENNFLTQLLSVFYFFPTWVLQSPNSLTSITSSFLYLKVHITWFGLNFALFILEAAEFSKESWETPKTWTENKNTTSNERLKAKKQSFC